MKELPPLGFVEAIKLASSRILDFSGRSRRSEFWWWMLIVMIANWGLTSFTSNLLVSSIIATIVMFFGLAATARRLQDADKSAWWVYISYALGIVSNIMVATSPAMNKLVDEAMSGSLNDKAIQKILYNGAGEMLAYTGVSILFAIFALIVVIMCLKDSDPETTEHGDSPKYVYE
jgi:uncharacterized membrane protein YhaH (DUF805 family)